MIIWAYFDCSSIGLGKDRNISILTMIVEPTFLFCDDQLYHWSQMIRALCRYPQVRLWKRDFGNGLYCFMQWHRFSKVWFPPHTQNRPFFQFTPYPLWLFQSILIIPYYRLYDNCMCIISPVMKVRYWVN